MGSVHDWQGGLEGLPVMLTVDEAARLLRIGRTLAYQLATRFLDGQPDGLPVIRLGGCLRVPRWALVELIHHGRVVSDVNAVVDEMIDAQLDTQRSIAAANRNAPQAARTVRAAHGGAQLSLLDGR